MGTPLGRDAYKIRLKVTSKGQGKTGGARVISFLDSSVIGVVHQQNQESITVYLLTIYDKADTASITDKELRDLIKGLK